MSNTFKLDSLLYNLSEATIKDFNFDFQNNRILISIDANFSNKIERFDVIFFNVSSFYFINDEGEDRLNFIEPERLWISSFDYIQDGIGKINISSNNEWAKDYYSGANFIIEICGTCLFIEAEAIQINDQYFHVDFPKI